MKDIAEHAIFNTLSFEKYIIISLRDLFYLGWSCKTMRIVMVEKTSSLLPFEIQSNVQKLLFSIPPIFPVNFNLEQTGGDGNGCNVDRTRFILYEVVRHHM